MLGVQLLARGRRPKHTIRVEAHLAQQVALASADMMMMVTYFSMAMRTRCYKHTAGTACALRATSIYCRCRCSCSFMSRRAHLQMAAWLVWLRQVRRRLATAANSDMLLLPKLAPVT
jgi:hypothetical protein